MNLSQKYVDDLVVALLSVNQYPVEKTWSLLSGLRSKGLLDPDRVVVCDAGELISALESAGYNRGQITWIVAPRLHTLMSKIKSGDLDGLTLAVEKQDEATAKELLISIPGIGPRVSATAWMLLITPEAE